MFLLLSPEFGRGFQGLSMRLQRVKFAMPAEARCEIFW